MIISASRRTDIPAYYSRWFMEKIAQGYCEVKNPFNQKVERVSLALDDVTSIVFWSRNYAPMLDDLKRLRDIGYSFYCQFTIIGYPAFIDPGSPSVESAAKTAHAIAKTFGPRSVVWRYDPVMLTSATDNKWHMTNFTEVLKRMDGATDTCVISFIDKYKKLDRNFFPLLKEHNIEYRHPTFDELTTLAVEMKKVTSDKGIEVTSCCEPELNADLIAPTSCVDIKRLTDVMDIPNLPPGVTKRPTRKGCGCYQSKDIGAYDTCIAACAYCYANGSRVRSLKNHERIEDSSPMLSPLNL